MLFLGSRTGHLLEPISEERAMRCLQRIDLLCAVREELLPHPRFDDLLCLCEPSFEVPQWWIPVQHDRDLLAGVAKYVCSLHTWNWLLFCIYAGMDCIDLRYWSMVILHCHLKRPSPPQHCSLSHRLKSWEVNNNSVEGSRDCLS